MLKFGLAPLVDCVNNPFESPECFETGGIPPYHIPTDPIHFNVNTDPLLNPDAGSPANQFNPCGNGALLNNGQCTQSTILNLGVQPLGLTDTGFLAQLKTFAATNPLVAYGGLALIGYLLFVKK